MAEGNDPRVYFAAERTMLAWVRTGLTVVGLGFVVARFGLFLSLLHPDRPGPSHLGSTFIGVGLVALGSVAVGFAGFQHRRFHKTLGPSEKPRDYIFGWSFVFAAAITIIGLTLATYLLIRASPP